LSAKTVVAEPGTCDTLTVEQRGSADRLMTEIYPHECCDRSLAVCRTEGRCRLVSRLVNEVCRRVEAGQDGRTIKRALEQRAASMIGIGSPAPRDLSDVDWMGDPDAPVEVVVYSCARCPFCSKSVPMMAHAVTGGALKGKAKLAFRLFPIRSHPNSVDGGLAFEAARELGRFWPYVLKVYAVFDGFDVDLLVPWAMELGLRQDEFERLMKDPATRERLVEAKKEGLRNGVMATPTYFLSRRLYKGDLDACALVDAVLEEYERVSGVLCDPE
jgi:hypothetical protein